MFEIYRGEDEFHVVYFTELDDHNREEEIDQAMAGEHFYDGFLRNDRLAEAKSTIDSVLARLNGEESVQPSDLDGILAAYAAD